MKKILVVNNDFDTLNTLKQLLERNGYLVEYTAIKEEVNSLVKNFEPDLVILDIVHSEIVESLDTLPTIGNVPVLLIAGRYEKNDKGMAFSTDNFNFIPFTMEGLRKKIKVWEMNSRLAAAS